MPCVDPEMTGTVTVSWTKHGTPKGMEKLLLSASEGKVSSGPPKFSLADPNFLESGVFSLLFVPKIGDQGLITCLVEKQERKLRKVILHALLTGRVYFLHPYPLYLSPTCLSYFFCFVILFFSFSILYLVNIYEYTSNGCKSVSSFEAPDIHPCRRMCK